MSTNPPRFLPSRVFIPDAQSVLFLADAGCRTVRCYITRLSLGEHFGATGHDGEHGRSSLRAFDDNRAFIERIAAKLLDAAPGTAGPVVITPREVLRESTRWWGANTASAAAPSESTR